MNFTLLGPGHFFYFSGFGFVLDTINLLKNCLVPVGLAFDIFLDHSSVQPTINCFLLLGQNQCFVSL